MTEREEMLLKDGRFANEYAEMIADELNVKEIKCLIGTDADGRTVEVIYKHDTIGDEHTPLDIYVDGVAQNKQTLAQALYNKIALSRCKEK